jgi:hypothetical protein
MGEVKKVNMGIFPIVPTYNNVIITLNTLKEDSIMLEESGLSDVQEVIAVSDTSKFKVGQKVIIDLNRLTKVINGDRRIEIDPIEVEGVQYTFLQEGLIKGVDNR